MLPEVQGQPLPKVFGNQGIASQGNQGNLSQKFLRMSQSPTTSTYTSAATVLPK